MGDRLVFESWSDIAGGEEGVHIAYMNEHMVIISNLVIQDIFLGQ